MGLSNRDYYSDDDSDDFGFEPKRELSFIGKLIVFCVVCFVITTLAGSVADHLRLTRDDVVSGQIWRLLTFGFTAPMRQTGATIIWFAFAMYWLYFAARMVIPLIGEKEFLSLYIASIIVGGLAWIAIPTNPGNLPVDDVQLAGTAMFIWAAMKYPRYTIMLFGIIPLQMWLIAGLIVLYQVWVSILSMRDGAMMATPLLAAIVFTATHQHFGWRFTALRESFAKLKPKPKLRVYSPENERTRDESLSTQVDAILEKISREGEASLTSKERKLLKKASKEYKDRV